jgi:hypothetical protein
MMGPFGIGRNSRESAHLLDNAEQNIGNSTTLLPEVGPLGPLVPSFTVSPQANPARLLALSGPSDKGQTTTIVMTASRVIGAANPNPGLPGPITGIIEYGSGGRFTRIEFDIPVGPFFGAINQASAAVEPQDGCAIVTVPTSVLRAYARYDNLLIATVLGTATAAYLGGQTLAQLQGVTDPNLMGPGGPVLVYNSGGTPTLPPGNYIVPSEPVSVKALAAYFTKPRSKVYKTLNCYISDETTSPLAVLVAGPATVGGFGNVVFWALPTGTKKVTILRFSGGSAAAGLHVMLHDGIRPVDYTTMATGSPALTLDIQGGVNILGLNSVDGNQKVTMLKLVCEIGI